MEPWALTNYFDLILEEKTISKYRVQIPAWFAILLEIKEDSIFAYGSILDSEKAVNCNYDTLAIFEKWGNWLLIQNKEELHLNLMPNGEEVDPATYIYQKRPDLNHLLVDPDDLPYSIETKMMECFNQKLLAGSYFHSKGGTVQFNFDGSIYGLGLYNEFMIDAYFGTSHSFKNLDNVALRNRKEHLLDHYHWEFENDQLILTEFLRETILQNGQQVMTDNYILGEKQNRLNFLN